MVGIPHFVFCLFCQKSRWKLRIYEDFSERCLAIKG